MWQRLHDIGVSYVLLMQLDSRVCRQVTSSELIAWSNYDYIGAPWAHLNQMVGNGGASFRSVRCMRIWSKMARQRSCHAFPDDLYISTHPVHQCLIAPFAIANAFAIESMHHPRPAFAHVYNLDGTLKSFSRSYLGNVTEIRSMCPENTQDY